MKSILNLNDDVILEILSFLKLKDIYNLFFSKKFFYNLEKLNYFWKKIGNREHPFFYIQNKKDFQQCILYVPEKDVMDSIQNNKWSKEWFDNKYFNLNKVPDHIIKSLVYDINKITLQKNILNNFYKSYFRNASQDWKIAMNIKIGELVDTAEEKEKEIYNHRDFLKKNCK